MTFHSQTRKVNVKYCARGRRSQDPGDARPSWPGTLNLSSTPRAGWQRPTAAWPVARCFLSGVARNFYLGWGSREFVLETLAMHMCFNFNLGLSILFPTSLCGVLAFSSASARLPPPPSSPSSPPSHFRQQLAHSHPHLTSSPPSGAASRAHGRLRRVCAHGRLWFPAVLGACCRCDLQSRCVVRARW